MQKKYKIINFVLVTLILLIFNSISIFANNEAELNFFFSTTCPHCKAEMEFLKSIEGDCQNLKINYYEVKENFKLLKELAEKYNTTTTAVPRTFIGDKAYVGFTDASGELEYNPVYKAYNGYKNIILDHINTLEQVTPTACEKGEECECEEHVDENAGKKSEFSNSWIFLLIIIYGIIYFLLKRKFKDGTGNKYLVSGFILVIIISLFIFISSQNEVGIKNFAESLPFPFFVTIIALADGFNPCAFTVLIILLSLLTYTKSKKDMGIIGLTFVITSAIMYFIFIMVMVLVGSWAFHTWGSTILLVLGILIIIAAIINLKDYFFFGKGVSLSISETDKSKFTAKAREIVNQIRNAESKKHFFFALFGTILLAIFVNLVELGCTAILPAVYMASLVKSFGDTISMGHIIWTAYYSFIYIIPLLIILIAFIYSFKSTRITEKQGRVLKLISGLFMLFFGIIMLFFPELLVFG